MAASPPKDMGIAPGTQVNGYTITRSIGAGQMGEVFEVRADDGHPRALKLLRTEALMDGSAQERFFREAKLCTQLASPHIVPVLDHGIHRGRPFIVMPMLEGADLETWLARGGPLRPDVAVAILLQACDGLAVAHRHGVVHRDLKPANIFLSEGREAFRVIVCDFGVAKIVDEDGVLTASGSVLGTPLYMSPEQMVDSKRVDKRSDVWALGMTLFHMLAGRTAHEDVRSIAELVLALRTGKMPSLQSLAPWVPPALARVVHAALLPRDERFPSVEELAAAIVRWGPRPVKITASSLNGLPAAMRAVSAPVATLPRSHLDIAIAEEATVAASPPVTPDPLVGKTLGGKYRLVRRLGSGGMGAVYEGVGPDGARAAVKVMHADAGKDEDASRRFAREVRAARAIESPYVVRPLDFGVDEVENIPFFAMELLNGRDLASVLSAVGSIAPPAAVELFVQAGRALGAAHALGITHRDIKPSNLFLHEPGDGTVVLKVCDFGIAKRVDAEILEASTELTRTGGLLGSPIYMSPEHAKNAKNVDARSDVWSLGLSLHEALSGARPWQGCTTIGEVIVAICTEDVPTLSTLAPWVDPSLAAVVSRCLAREPSLRWATVTDLVRALEPFGLGRMVRVDELHPAADAGERQSARATSVRPPGLATSGSLAAAARPAMEASVHLPVEKRSAWKWAVGALAVAGLAGGGVALRSYVSSGRESLPVVASVSTAPPTTSEPLPGTARSPDQPMSAAPSERASAPPASVPRASGVQRPPLRPTASGAAAPAALAVTAPIASPPQAPGAASVRPATSRADGRVNSRKDD